MFGQCLLRGGAKLASAGTVTLTAFVGFHAGAIAAGPPDQVQPVYYVNCAVNSDSTQWPGQIFTAGRTGILDQVDIVIDQIGPVFGVPSPPPLHVQIRAVLPDGTPSPVILATAIVPAASVPQNIPAWIAVPFSPGAPSVAGTAYAIVLGAPGASVVANDYYQWNCGGSTPGQLWVSNDAGVTWGGHNPQLNFGFKTYVTDSVPVVSEAPLPILLPLVAGLAFVGIYLVRRREINGQS
jgi:hypothetical protein